MAVCNKSLTIGIDLGTTNSCVAVWRNSRVEVIHNKQGDFLTPSWAAYTDKEVLIGKTAKNNAYRNLEGTFFGIKRIIGRKFNDVVVQDAIRNWKFKVHEDNSGVPKIQVMHKNERKYVYPEEISALILQEMKESAEECLGKKDITDAVITVPAYFNDHQRQATKDAAKIAGLNVLRLINEPTAAAIAYIYDKYEKKKRNVLVYDLGGGTFDVSIVSLENRDVIVKATRGNTNLGGSNFDDRCIAYFTELIADKYNIEIEELLNVKVLRRLQNQVERAKHDLASSVTTNIELPSVYNGIDVFEELTRARFDDLNADLYNKTIEVVEQCIKEAKLTKEDIDDIVLVGGSTRVLKIQEKLEEFFSKPVSKAINPDQAVAQGAAILAAELNGTLPVRLNIKDVIPMSLGIETLNDRMNILIKRNSQVPVEAKRTYTTGVQGNNAIKIVVFEGDNRIASKNLKLGYFNLLNLPENPSVDVTFKVDINGIVKVNAIESSTGINRTINVALNKGRLSEREIHLLRSNSVRIKEDNEKLNVINRKRNQFESYLLQIKEDVIANKYNINKIQEGVVLNMVDVVLTWLTSKEAFDLEKLETKYSVIYNYCTTLFGEAVDIEFL